MEENAGQSVKRETWITEQRDNDGTSDSLVNGLIILCTSVIYLVNLVLFFSSLPVVFIPMNKDYQNTGLENE